MCMDVSVCVAVCEMIKLVLLLLSVVVFLLHTSDCCFLSYSPSEMDHHIQSPNQSSPTWSAHSVSPWRQKKWRSSGGSESLATTTLSEVHTYIQSHLPPDGYVGRLVSRCCW